MSACEQPKPVTRQCDGPDCTSCAPLAGYAVSALDLAGAFAGMAKTLLVQRDEMARALREHEEAAARLEAERQKYAESTAGLEAERQKYAELNRRLNARANGIRAVTACEKKESSGRRGRPPGKGATVNRQFEESEADVRETADLGACPGCGGDLSGVTGEYARRYERLTVLTEKVLCTVRRRYCCKCKKQYTARPKGVAPNARVSANHSALLAWLNVKGLSHGGTAELSSDFLKAPVSRSGSYRRKVRTATALRPDYEAVRERLVKEEVLHCDELWWPLGKKKGVVVAVQGRTGCLMSVETSRSSETLKHIIGDFQGITVQDSYTGWLHIGVNRQMCIYHQMRLIKWDLKYRRLDGETTVFLKELLSIHKGIYEASRGGDEGIRLAEADRLDVELAALMGRRWEDKGGNIGRYRKRYRRESRFLTVCLRVPGVPPDNNPVERSNRKVVAARSDGGGNRSGKGMETNSILFTNMVTDWLAGRSFFDHMVLAASGDG